MSSLVSLSRHTLKQLKFVLPGGVLTYYFDSHNLLLGILNGDAGSMAWAAYVRLQLSVYGCLSIVTLLGSLLVYHYCLLLSLSPSSSTSSSCLS